MIGIMVNILKRGVGLKKKKAIESLVDIGFFAPQFILYAAFTLLPFVVALPMIFTNYANFLDKSPSFIGLENITNMFSYPIVDQLIPALKRTSIFVILNYAMVFVLGLPLAIMLYEFRLKFRGVFFTSIFLPLMLSGVGLGMIITLLFSRDSGSINLLLTEMGLISQPFDIQTPGVTTFVMPIMVGWRSAGFNMAIFLSGLMAIPNDTIEASIVDGARYYQRLFRIYIPQIIPSIAIATILCLLGSFGVFDECIGFGALNGNENANFLSVLIYRMGFSSTAAGGSQIGSLSQAVTISMVMYLPLVIIAVFLNKIQKKLQY